MRNFTIDMDRFVPGRVSSRDNISRINILSDVFFSLSFILKKNLLIQRFSLLMWAVVSLLQLFATMFKKVPLFTAESKILKICPWDNISCQATYSRYIKWQIYNQMYLKFWLTIEKVFHTFIFYWEGIFVHVSIEQCF